MSTRFRVRIPKKLLMKIIKIEELNNGGGDDQ